MKQVFLFISIICSFKLFGQESSFLPKGASSVSESPEWNLSQYSWSQAHHNIDKSGKALFDFEAVENFSSIGNFSDGDFAISPNGRYFAFGTQKTASRTRDKLIVKSVDGSWQTESITGVPGFFSNDSKKYIYYDNGSMRIITLGQNSDERINDITSFEKSTNQEWFAYQFKTDSSVILKNILTGKVKHFDRVLSYSFDKSGVWFSCQLNNDKQELVIYNLAKDTKQHFQSILTYSFDKEGKALILKTIADLKYVNLSDLTVTTVWVKAPATTLNSYTLDNNGQQVALIQKEGNKNSIWYWKVGMERSVLKADEKTEGINKFVIMGVAFINDDSYLKIILKKQPETQNTKENAIKIDIWSYKDSVIQSTQPYLIKKPRSYNALLNLENGRVIYAEKEYEQIISKPRAAAFGRELPKSEYIIVEKNGISEERINGDRFWEKDFYNSSFWLVSLKTGNRDSIFNAWGVFAALAFSSDERYFVYCDLVKGCHYYSYDVQTGKRTDITSGISMNIFGNEDVSGKPNSVLTRAFGIADWLPNGDILVYDKFDIWQLDPTGKKSAFCLTNGFGRRHQVVLRLSGNTYQGSSVLAEDILLLKAFNLNSKYNGFFKKNLLKIGDPEELYMKSCIITGHIANAVGMEPVKAGEKNGWIVRRQTADESQNYFLTSDFKEFQRLTDLQPQRKFNWLTAELHSYRRLDGTLGQGILYKPENFDPKIKYPVLVTFYVQATQYLNQFPEPQLLISPIFVEYPTWFVNRGYLVFVPDIQFNIGKWGPSTVNSVDGCARYLKSLPFVDSKHIGACGHSNSGRFGYYVLTHSRSFAAMSVGAGTTDILSNALSIQPPASREESRLEWAEVSAVGTGLGNLWQNKSSWLDQTSVLHADNAISPLLLFHCKNDGALRAGQGAEMYIALRRLEKKVWWLQYDDGGHTVGDRDSKDLTIRSTQFYDHYLMDAPAPNWMTKGIPFKLKGIEARYELDPSGSCAMQGKNHCYVCEAWNKQYQRNPLMFENEIKDWSLDKDIKEELTMKTTEERKRLDKEGAGEQKKIVDILKNGYPEDKKKTNK